MGQLGNQKENLKKYLETNANENTTIQNLWNAAKAVLSWKFTVIQAIIKKTRKISSKQPNLPPKRNRKRRTNKT